MHPPTHTHTPTAQAADRALARFHMARCHSTAQFLALLATLPQRLQQIQVRLSMGCCFGEASLALCQACSSRKHWRPFRTLCTTTQIGKVQLAADRQHRRLLLAGPRQPPAPCCRPNRSPRRRPAAAARCSTPPPPAAAARPGAALDHAARPRRNRQPATAAGAAAAPGGGRHQVGGCELAGGGGGGGGGAAGAAGVPPSQLAGGGSGRFGEGVCWLAAALMSCACSVAAVEPPGALDLPATTKPTPTATHPQRIVTHRMLMQPGRPPVVDAPGGQATHVSVQLQSELGLKREALTSIYITSRGVVARPG